MKHYLFYEKNHNKTIFQYKATYLWLSFAMMMSIMAVIGIINKKQIPILFVLASFLGRSFTETFTPTSGSLL